MADGGGEGASCVNRFDSGGDMVDSGERASLADRVDGGDMADRGGERAGLADSIDSGGDIVDGGERACLADRVDGGGDIVNGGGAAGVEIVLMAAMMVSLYCDGVKHSDCPIKNLEMNCIINHCR